MTLVPTPSHTPTSAPPIPLTFTNIAAAAGLDMTPNQSIGMQWGDYDGDGRPDLHVSRSHTKVSALYHNEGNGTFTEVLASASLIDPSGSPPPGQDFDRHGCSWGDFDNDGDLDFACVGGGSVGTTADFLYDRVWRNNGDGTFAEVGRDLGIVDGLGLGVGLTWLDYDNDYDLDLFVANDERSSAPNRLYRNEGSGFIDVTACSGVGLEGEFKGVSVGDYNGDSRPDLMLARGDFGAVLLRNNADGTFIDDTSAAGLLTPGKGAEGISWADYDNDGDLDVFLARSYGIKSALFRNSAGAFTDVTNGAGISGTRARSGVWGDYDNDGDLDLFIVRKYDSSSGANEPDELWLNDGDGTFTESSAGSGVRGTSAGSGDSAATADFNGDGYLDLVVTNGEFTAPTTMAPPALFKNAGGNRNWLRISPRMTGANTGAFGAKVWLVAGGKLQYREVADGAFSRHAQNEQTLHFGIGTSAVVDTITIRWPDGVVETMSGIAANQLLEPVHSPSPAPAQADRCIPLPGFDDVSVAAGLRNIDQKSFGMQWADYDNDGWLDLYVGRHGGGIANLYHNSRNGTFTNVSRTADVQTSGDRHGCVWGDLTRDGWIDLFCTVSGTDHVLINRGNGTFRNEGTTWGANRGGGRTANLLDYNKDGRIDVLYGDTQRVRLWRNTGSALSLVTTYGNTGNQGPRSGSTADYNGDGYVDAFISKWPEPTWQVLRGTSTGFTDATAGIGVPMDSGSQSATWADYDNDGDLDVFVANWQYFCCSYDASLLENLGNGTFRNVTLASGIARSTARMGLWGDFNNDGWQDLLVVNGMTNDDGFNRPDQLYLNTGEKTFVDASGPSGLRGPTVGSGDSAAWADFNRDGYLDIVVGNGSGQLQCEAWTVPYCIGQDKLYRNRGGTNRSLQLRLAATSNPFGLGAKVWVTTPAGTQYRELTDGMVGKSQLPQMLHFGLGTYTSAAEVRIRWPNGVEERLYNVPAGALPVKILQGTGFVPYP